MKNAVFIFFAILLAGCAAPQKDNTSDSINESAKSGNSSNPTGLSLSDAISFPDAKNEFEGVNAERAWVQKNMPGYQKKNQALMTKDGKCYDRITVVSAHGQEKDIYFDITNFYGKFGK